MSNQGKIDEICNNVQQAFNPPRIRFMKIASYPASNGLRISFDYRNNTKTITFSKRYLDEHSKAHLADFLNAASLSTLKINGDQHLRLD
jgi:uncharacterized protein (DUF1684 family)